MAPAQIPVLLTQKPSTENGINRATILFLAWPSKVDLPLNERSTSLVDLEVDLLLNQEIIHIKHVGT